jgi:hypothetical protein
MRRELRARHPAGAGAGELTGPEPRPPEGRQRGGAVVRLLPAGMFGGGGAGIRDGVQMACKTLAIGARGGAGALNRG